MNILVVDTVYPQFLDSFHADQNRSYHHQLGAIMEASFGTFDAYSRNLSMLGWTANDVIYNSVRLQERWAADFGHGLPGDIFQKQVSYYAPDVLFMQDLNVPLPSLPASTIKAAQCSCPWPGDEMVRQYDIIFTSFPHYVNRIQALGPKAVYNPLAFDPIVIERIARQERKKIDGRIHDVIFVGGVGNPSHWKRGMETLEVVAREIPSFKWWGYGIETLPYGSPLIKRWEGDAWGLDMYWLFCHSRIVLNRHGEVAEEFANNMRMFEATGCGALLLTEKARNIGDFFKYDEVATYGSAYEAVDIIKSILIDDEYAPSSPKSSCSMAAAGQHRTMKDHTYLKRMELVSKELKALL